MYEPGMTALFKITERTKIKKLGEIFNGKQA